MKGDRLIIDEVKAFLDANPGVQWIDAFLFDMNGIPRGKRMRRSDLPGAVTNGIMMPTSVFIMDPLGNCIEETGRLRAIIPVSNCGARRVSVAAAVKANAPNAPIMKPSNDPRVGGRVSRTTTAGTSIRIIPPIGTPSPSRTIRSPTIPAPSGTPYERATIAPVMARLT